MEDYCANCYDLERLGRCSAGHKFSVDPQRTYITILAGWLGKYSGEGCSPLVIRCLGSRYPFSFHQANIETFVAATRHDFEALLAISFSISEIPISSSEAASDPPQPPSSRLLDSAHNHPTLQRGPTAANLDSLLPHSSNPGSCHELGH